MGVSIIRDNAIKKQQSDNGQTNDKYRNF